MARHGWPHQPAATRPHPDDGAEAAAVPLAAPQPVRRHAAARARRPTVPRATRPNAAGPRTRQRVAKLPARARCVAAGAAAATRHAQFRGGADSGILGGIRLLWLGLGGKLFTLNDKAFYMLVSALLYISPPLDDKKSS